MRFDIFDSAGDFIGSATEGSGGLGCGGLLVAALGVLLVPALIGQGIYDHFHPAPIPTPVPSMSVVDGAVGQAVHYWDAKGHDATITVTGIFENTRMKDFQGRSVGTATDPYVCATYTVTNNTKSSDDAGFSLRFPDLDSSHGAAVTCNGVTVRPVTTPQPGQTLTFALAASEPLRQHVRKVEAGPSGSSDMAFASWTVGASPAANANQSAQPTAAPTQDPATSKMGTTQTLSLGDHGDRGRIAITPTTLGRRYRFDDYLVVKVTIKNLSAEVSSVPGNWISARTRYGETRFDVSQCSDETGLKSLGSPNLEPGESITGIVALEVPDAKDDQFQTMTFEGRPDYSNSPTVTFRF